MTAMVIRRGLAVVAAGIVATGIVGGTAGTASAHPVPGCNSKTYPGYRVRHLHLRAATVCKAFKAIGGGKFQVFYKIKGTGEGRQIQVHNDGTHVRSYFVRGGTGVIRGRLQGHRTFFRSCAPNGSKCGPLQ
jgi:hypothetical protein